MKRIMKTLSTKQKFMWAAAYIPTAIVLNSSFVQAATVATTGVPEVDNGLRVLKTLMLGVVSAIGLVILIKNIGDFAQAYQQQDSQGMHMAGKGLAAGLIMTLIGPVLAAFGFAA